MMGSDQGKQKRIFYVLSAEGMAVAFGEAPGEEPESTASQEFIATTSQESAVATFPEDDDLMSLPPYEDDC